MDVNHNQKGGIFANDIDALSPEFGETVGALSQPRWYKVRNLSLAIFSTLTVDFSDERS